MLKYFLKRPLIDLNNYNAHYSAGKIDNKKSSDLTNTLNELRFSLVIYISKTEKY